MSPGKKQYLDIHLKQFIERFFFHEINIKYLRKLILDKDEAKPLMKSESGECMLSLLSVFLSLSFPMMCCILLSLEISFGVSLTVRYL